MELGGSTQLTVQLTVLPAGNSTNTDPHTRGIHGRNVFLHDVFLHDVIDSSGSAHHSGTRRCTKRGQYVLYPHHQFRRSVTDSNRIKFTQNKLARNTNFQGLQWYQICVVWSSMMKTIALYFQRRQRRKRLGSIRAWDQVDCEARMNTSAGETLTHHWASYERTQAQPDATKTLCSVCKPVAVPLAAPRSEKCLRKHTAGLSSCIQRMKNILHSRRK